MLKNTMLLSDLNNGNLVAAGQSFHANFGTLGWLGIVLIVSCLSSVFLALIKGERANMNSYFQQYIKKFMQYGGALIISFVLRHSIANDFIGDEHSVLGLLNNGLVILMIYIETLNILQNLYDVDSKGKFSQVAIKPLMSILTLKITHNFISKIKDHHSGEASGGAEDHSNG